MYKRLGRLSVPVVMAAVVAAGAGAPRDVDRDPQGLFNAAVAAARRGDPDETLALLRRSFEAGYERPSQVLVHPDLGVVRGAPGARARLRDLLREFARERGVIMVAPDEPGPPLVVSGVVRDEAGRPLEGAIIYVHHTDSEGISEGDENPRLFAYLRTGADGRYTYRTIRPAGYPGTDVEQHVHYEVAAAGHKTDRFRLGFADDPWWRDRSELPEWVRPVTLGPNGAPRCVFDIVLAALPAPAGAPGNVLGIDFETQVRPIVDPRCMPCHFEGGKMYDELPFDRAETILVLGEKLFTRIQDEKEQAVIRAFLEQQDRPE